MNIKLVVVGKLHQPFAELVKEYLKRCGKFNSAIELVELKEDKNIEKNILAKAEKSFLVLLDEKGKEMTSQKLASFFEQRMMIGKDLIFVIGGTDGHSEELKQKADLLFSLSQLTFAHELATVLFAETIFRALSIVAGHPYHRG